MSEFRPSFKKVEGEVNVTIQEIVTNNSVLVSNQISSVPTDTLTTIATLPANGIKYVTKIMCSGEVNAKWDIFIDSVRKFTLRTTDRSRDFDFSTPLKVPATSVLDVKATHHGDGSTATLEAAILGYSTA